MIEEVEIAFAAAPDLDAVCALESKSFPAPWRREFFEGELRASGRFNLVARRGGRVIGYLFSMWFSDEMHVNKIAVAPEERRRGIAVALMDRCFEFARSSGVETISLEVRQSNSAAQDFYASLQFEPVYVRPRYYPDGEAAVVMSRDVQ
jgi:ribosomal-protein-alanine N-acetyltransferase